ncbi:TPA: hypothetical protein DDZ86_03960 [Candidatus Dependentiae bacterium]|nr:MAG: hypothetical protein UW09_C0003G0145 [candidate division TM6 bacterium GW2011_GWF2_43_87]HBL98771.1 hypothetical protein [Candidatus Dependentiae bacterium]
MDDFKDLLNRWVLSGMISQQQAEKMLANLSDRDTQGKPPVSEKGEPLTIDSERVDVDHVEAPTSNFEKASSEAVLEEGVSAGQRSAGVIKFLLIFGAILLGVGATLFVSSHWGDFHRLIKIAIAAGGTLSALALGFLLRSDRMNRPHSSDAILFATTLLCGATIHLIAQLYNVGLQEQWLVLLWIMAIIPLVYSVASTAMALTTSVLLFIAHYLFVQNVFGSWFTFNIFGGRPYRFSSYGLSFIVLGAFFFLISRVHSYYPRLEKLARVFRRVGLGVGLPALLAVVLRHQEKNWVYPVTNTIYHNPALLFFGFMVGVGILSWIWVVLKRSKGESNTLAITPLVVAAQLIAFVGLIYPAYPILFVLAFNLIWIAGSAVMIKSGIVQESLARLSLGLLALILVVNFWLSPAGEAPILLLFGILFYGVGHLNPEGELRRKGADICGIIGLAMGVLGFWLLTFAKLLGEANNCFSYVDAYSFMGAFYLTVLIGAALGVILIPPFMRRKFSVRDGVESFFVTMLVAAIAVLLFYKGDSDFFVYRAGAVSGLSLTIMHYFFNGIAAVGCIIVAAKGVWSSDSRWLNGGIIGLVGFAISHFLFDAKVTGATPLVALLVLVGAVLLIINQLSRGLKEGIRASLAPSLKYYEIIGLCLVVCGFCVLSFESVRYESLVPSTMSVFYFGVVLLLALCGSVWQFILSVRGADKIDRGIFLLSIVSMGLATSAFFNHVSYVDQIPYVVLVNICCGVVAVALVWRGFVAQSRLPLVAGMVLTGALIMGRSAELPYNLFVCSLLSFAVLLAVVLLLLGRWREQRPLIADVLRMCQQVGLGLGVVSLYILSFQGIVESFYQHPLQPDRVLSWGEWQMSIWVGQWISVLLAASVVLLVVLSGRLPCVNKGERVLENILALSATGSAVAFYFSMGIVSPAWIWNVVLVNSILLAFSIVFMVSGVRREEMGRVNLVMFLIVLLSVSRYFDALWNLISRSLFFMLGGLLLLVCGSILEWQRRVLKEAFAHSEQASAAKKEQQS